MIQFALGGYRKDDGAGSYETNVLYDAPLAFIEPDFTIFTPLKFDTTAADTIFVLFRERFDGTTFINDPVNATGNYILTVTDATTGSAIFSYISNTFYNELWVEDDPQPTGVIEIYPMQIVADGVASNTTGSRLINVRLKNAVTLVESTFSILVEFKNQAFYYLIVDKNNFTYRDTVAKSGTLVHFVPPKNSSYILVSPMSYFSETIKELSHFSYPISNIYYARQRLINNEEFVFSVSAVSNSILMNYVNVYPVPKYSYMGVVSLDNGIRDVVTTSEWIDIKAVGHQSGFEDVFRIYVDARSIFLA